MKIDKFCKTAVVEAQQKLLDLWPGNAVGIFFDEFEGYGLHMLIQAEETKNAPSTFEGYPVNSEIVSEVEFQ